MKKNIFIIVLAIIALGLAGYAAFSTYQTKKQLAQPIAQSTPQSNIQNVALPDNSALNSNNIHVFTPIQESSISSPVKITGEVRVFENQFSIRVIDGNGKILDEENAMGNNGDMGIFNPFEKEISYPAPSTSNGTIEVFDYSAKDGTEIDKVTIPVKFSDK